MSSINNNNKKTQAKQSKKAYKNPRKGLRDDFFNFSMDIDDDIFNPFNDDFFGFNSLENRMFRNLSHIFTPFDLVNENENEKEEKPEEVKPKEVKEVKVEEEKPKEVKVEEEKPKEVKVEEEKEEEINTDTKKEEEINTNMEVEEEKPKEVKVEEEKEEEINTDTKKEEEINTNMEVEEEKPKEVKVEEEINTDTKKEEEKPKEEPKEENKGSYYAKVYTCSYNNLNGKEESYSSQTIKQSNNGHNIAETKENYKNSDGVCKSAYQRDLDDKTTRFIKEKNMKTGEHNQKKVVKGLEENEINDFNKAYNDYCKKCGFKKNFHKLNTFDPFGITRKQLSDGNSNLFFHRLLF